VDEPKQPFCGLSVPLGMGLGSSEGVQKMPLDGGKYSIIMGF
jgi:hypothetical protein